MSFAKNLAKFRKEKGLTQEELVRISGVAISQIRRYETNKSTPSLDAITKLVKALGVSIDELVFAKATGVAQNKIIDRELLEQFEFISKMSKDEKYVVKKILEGVIVKHQVESVIKPKNEKSWSERFREITDRLAKGAERYEQDEIDSVIDEAVEAVRARRYAHSQSGH
ncbi:MAG: helix-turn-helix transcriptional regulator [Thermodesulfobacteriota bacterium]|nr:helix-turn-helix transcriptional regulator [Thermodesulfobacteriota bacterium]